MKKSLKNFIEENIELIEDGKFKELYSTVRPLLQTSKNNQVLRNNRSMGIDSEGCNCAHPYENNSM